MKRRTAEALARLYPAPWRARFGAEFIDVLETDVWGPRVLLDVLGAAVAERLFNCSGLGTATMAAFRVYVAALFCAVLLLGTFEWRTDEDLVTLLVLASTSFAMGALRPRLFWLSALLLGCVVAALNLLTALTGLRPIYESAGQANAHGVAYGMSLLILVVPALVAAGVGAVLRRTAAAGRSSASR